MSILLFKAPGRLLAVAGMMTNAGQLQSPEPHVTPRRDFYLIIYQRSLLILLSFQTPTIMVSQPDPSPGPWSSPPPLPELNPGE